jgi:hypothetical protein
MQIQCFALPLVIISQIYYLKKKYPCKHFPRGLPAKTLHVFFVSPSYLYAPR